MSYQEPRDYQVIGKFRQWSPSQKPEDVPWSYFQVQVTAGTKQLLLTGDSEAEQAIMAQLFHGDLLLRGHGLSHQICFLERPDFQGEMSVPGFAI